MALASALVDRARRVRNETSGSGQADQPGQWFKARLTSPRSQRTLQPGQRFAAEAQLMFAVKDADGQELSFRRGDRVEVDSKQLGREVFAFASAPRPLRAKRKLLGYEADLTRQMNAPTEEGFA